MSGLRQGNGDDYPDAAEKHLEDSKVLMAGSRHDGAAYLAGYVVECVLKTLIQLETGRHVILTTCRDCATGSMDSRPRRAPSMEKSISRPRRR